MVIYLEEDWHKGAKIFNPECDRSRLFCKIIGSSFIPENAIEYILKLGYEIKTTGARRYLVGGDSSDLIWPA